MVEPDIFLKQHTCIMLNIVYILRLQIILWQLSLNWIFKLKYLSSDKHYNDVIMLVYDYYFSISINSSIVLEKKSWQTFLY